MLSFEDFSSLSRAHTVIPLVRAVPADLHTPVSTYLILRDAGTPSFLLESAEPDERVGRFSFVGTSPRILVVSREGVTLVREGKSSVSRREPLLDILKEILGRYRQAPGIVEDGFTGGFLGYFGYDAVAQLERIPLPPADVSAPPESQFGFFTTVVRFDHRNQVLTAIRNVVIEPDQPLREQYDRGCSDLDALLLRLSRTASTGANFRCTAPPSLRDGDRDAFYGAVRRAQEYITEGDIFQVVLSRRAHTSFTGDPFPVYRALRIINPSPYLFYMDFCETVLIGSSPELLVRVQGGTVEVMPIAGTRRRGGTPEEDRKLEEDLLANEKERAEHVMLIDLGRNDVGRVSRFGSVSVPDLMGVERFSHVMHIVSTVTGTLRDDVAPLDALRSCFPAGTVTGAPKVRAMEIISELECTRRGIYAGAVGYLGLNGTLDTCIAIRTIIAHHGTLSIQTGAGIVADSDPEREYDETVNKAQALVDAVTLAEGGLRGNAWEYLARSLSR